jgi:hypothetical protein
LPTIIPADSPNDAYFTGTSGTLYNYADIGARTRDQAPHMLGKHIFQQLEAISLLDEFLQGTTPFLVPLTFAGKPDQRPA